ncbi:M20/M25/M40 family metallo-hydrolase [Virgibacillus chiguensis]|uniref:Amidohydrolase n=1 Tax=Virgibacillus chiguensis TaxID=411959 RepID=A0A1M5PBW6_9BACI|nr:M20/M25/M40 family metallo-hydrolase [Virgibacillus chiguensis]SHG99334.1 amidohydrolase [Virgibacillus chiguensis]
MQFKQQYEAIKQVAEDIYYHPELGYKEKRTKKQVIDYLKAVNLNIDIENFSLTGFKTSLGTKGTDDLHIAFIAELDAVYAPTHMYADEQTGAAHNCGHYSQIAIALALYQYFFKTKAYKNLDFKLTFVFVPAEEYLDLTYRQQLLQEGQISHYGGKPEAMKLGVFEDIDLSICVHAIGGEFSKRTIEMNCDLAGFLYKKYTFEGKATHAGFDPFSSKNAYHMSTLFNTAIGLSRQQLKESEHVRINPIIMESDMSTNVIPNHIVVGTDLRTKSVDYLKATAEKLDDAAKGSAMALQGNVTIDTQMGYLPFVQDRYLSTFVEAAFHKNTEIDEILNDNFISAAGDIGDLSFMMPCIQIGYSGFTGTIHGDDFIDVDPTFIYEIFPRFLAQVLEQMSGSIDKAKLYKQSYTAYQELIASIVQNNMNPTKK